MAGKPRPSVVFDRVADTYDTTRGGKPRAERFAVAIAPHLDTAVVTLDVGVGTGILAAALVRRGFRFVGVDLSAAMLAKARERLGNRVARGDARRLPVRDASVDQALSVWVLHVVGDATAVLREVARVLRPGGRYVVMPGGGQTPDDEIGRRTQAVERALDPDRRRDDSAQRVAELAPDAGFRVRAMVEHAWQFERSPADVAAALESRSQSYLWDVDDERWNRHVVPTIEWLRSLPDPERPIVRRARDTLVVLERE
ncbi:MAG TPA: class I SAM-dependent methyltransferase [Actinomycetota bacterium]|jgi:SAM-dependent methyltransferase